MRKEKVKDIIYKEYQRQINMDFSDLIKWKNNPLSKLASESRKPINLALRLSTHKSKWTTRHYRGALKAISYLKRAKKIKSKNHVGKTRLTYNDIALRNWGYDSKRR